MINLLNKINTTDNLYLSENYLNSNEKFQTFIEIFGKDIDTIFTQKLLSNGINNSSYQGFNFLDKSEEKLNYFGKKNFMELLEEDYDIYKLYENGEEYKDVLDKKRKRIEKEKEEKEKKKKTDIRKKETIKDLDDDDDDESPLFKIEKIKPNDDDNNFLSILNKSPEDNIQKKEDHEFDIKELENDGEIINDINVNVNEDIEPNKMENKIYNKMYNEDLKEENKEKEKEENNNEKDNKEKNEDNVNIGNISRPEKSAISEKLFGKIKNLYQEKLEENEEGLYNKDENIKKVEKRLKEVEIYIHKLTLNMPDKNKQKYYQDFTIKDFLEINNDVARQKDLLSKKNKEIKLELNNTLKENKQ